MSEVRIRILDTTNSILGYLDLEDSEDFPLRITKTISDLNDFTSRSGSYTTNFTIPATKANNRLLHSLYHTNTKQYKGYFNKKDAEIIINNSLFDKGKIRIEQIDKDGVVNYYNAVFFGENSDWSSKLKESYLNDLSFDSSAIIRTGANIGNSWTHTYDSGDEYIYCRINRGGIDSRNVASSNALAIDLKDFFPELFLKKVLDKVFSYTGYTLSSTFLSSAAFKNLILSYFNSKNALEPDLNERLTQFEQLNYNYVHAGLTTNSSLTASFYIGQLSSGRYLSGYSNFTNNDTTAPNTDDYSLFNSTTQTFTAPEDGYYTINVVLNYQQASSNRHPDVINDRLMLLAKIPNTNSLDWYGGNVILNKGGYYYIDLTEGNGSGSAYGSYIDCRLLNIPLEQNTTVQFILAVNSRIYPLGNDPSGTPYTYRNLTAIANYTYIEVIQNQREYGEQTALGSLLDGTKMPLIGLIQDITKMFNLYWTTNPSAGIVYCEPRDSFYSLTNALDWTDKIDVSNYSFSPVSVEYPRYVRFEYADDSNDAYLNNRNLETKNKYGSYEHDFGNNYKDETKTIKLDYIAASYFTNKDKFGYDNLNNGLFYPDTLISDDATQISNNLLLDHNPRILNLTSSSQYLYTKFTYSGVDYHQVPLAIMHDYTVDASTILYDASVNLMFGSFNNKNGLFASYYAKTFDTIQNGIKLQIDANLTLSEIKNFNFKKAVYFSAPYDIKGYWIVEEIANINPFKQQLVKLTLIKYNNLEPIAEQTTGINVYQENPQAGDAINQGGKTTPIKEK